MKTCSHDNSITTLCAECQTGNGAAQPQENHAAAARRRLVHAGADCAAE